METDEPSRPRVRQASPDSPDSPDAPLPLKSRPSFPGDPASRPTVPVQEPDPVLSGFMVLEEPELCERAATVPFGGALRLL